MAICCCRRLWRLRLCVPASVFVADSGVIGCTLPMIAFAAITYCSFIGDSGLYLLTVATMSALGWALYCVWNGASGCCTATTGANGWTGTGCGTPDRVESCVAS